MRDKGSYDIFERTWKDEDENRLRATFDPEDAQDTAVIRIWQAGDGEYWKYFNLSQRDREDLIKLLGGTV